MDSIVNKMWVYEIIGNWPAFVYAALRWPVFV